MKDVSVKEIQVRIYTTNARLLVYNKGVFNSIITYMDRVRSQRDMEKREHNAAVPARSGEFSDSYLVNTRAHEQHRVMIHQENMLNGKVHNDCLLDIDQSSIRVGQIGGLDC